MTISFTDETIIEPLEEEDPLIPMNKFEFVTLEDLSNLASETSKDGGGNQKILIRKFKFNVKIKKIQTFYFFKTYMI